MIGPEQQRNGSHIHFWAILIVTLVVMVLGVLVVVAPDLMRVPQVPSTPAATPIATVVP